MFLERENKKKSFKGDKHMTSESNINIVLTRNLPIYCGVGLKLPFNDTITLFVG